MRPDLRAPDEMRSFKVTVASGSSVVQWGDTLVSCSTTFEEVPPHEDRPSEGMHTLSIASPRKLDPVVHGEALDSIRNCLHKTRALDLEGLVIRIGELVFILRSEVVVQSNDGGLIQAMHLALVSSLLSTRLPGPRGPRPVVLHHLPLAVTFGYSDTGFCFLDPTRLESAALQGEVTVFANAQGELCGVYKHGGIGLSLNVIQQAQDIAIDVIRNIHSELMTQIGTVAPQNLRTLCAPPVTTEKKEPESLDELQKQIVAEMRGDETPNENDDEEDEPLDPVLLGLFQ